MAERTTSKAVASDAARILGDESSTGAERRVAASALAQAGGNESEKLPDSLSTASLPNPSEAVATRIRFAKLDPATEPDPKHPGQTRERKQSPTLEIASGVYHRKFDVNDQPFELAGIRHEEDGRSVVDITPAEELQILLRDGHFVVVEDAKEQSANS